MIWEILYVKMYRQNMPGKEICKSAGASFVNNRLIGLIESVIIEYVKKSDSSYIMSNNDVVEAPLDELVDMGRLREDMFFAKKSIIQYCPRDYDPAKALYAFFSLYDILKAEKVFKPEIVMEYILYNIMKKEVEMSDENVEDHYRFRKLPEPVRTQMIQELEEVACPGYLGYPCPTVDYLISFYEDLELSMDFCFENFDCKLLDVISEERMEETGYAQKFGINTSRSRYVTDVDGVKISVRVPRWEYYR